MLGIRRRGEKMLGIRSARDNDRGNTRSETSQKSFQVLRNEGYAAAFLEHDVWRT